MFCAADDEQGICIHICGEKSACLAVLLSSLVVQIRPVPFCNLALHCQDDVDGSLVALVMGHEEVGCEDRLFLGRLVHHRQSSLREGITCNEIK